MTTPEVFHMGSDPEQFAAFGGGVEAGWYASLDGGKPFGPFRSEIDAQSNATWERLRNPRFQVVTDGLTCRPRFSRRYAVIDTKRLQSDGKPMAVLETDDPRRAHSFCDECNTEGRT